ncbi:isoprenoid biosynthesis glyoxalase ElbB [Aestuariibacter salexigens]|uniref:isoprenoid biosynthesis glyoxalase ElbB n=1 Tax=Aestuariibacter salexigens TaxID=226010 RepID=UPI0003F6951D|nr:isoprenoid biosynthesis glyoxalase ElbB [Aestuariibacter salexigens]
MKKIAVILSGCGVFDGAEIHESVLTLYFIEKFGGTYQCFAPDIEQLHVVNHVTGEVVDGETRNVLVESARIARGDIKDLSELNADEFDALILPGGFGAAKNLCDFALKGADADIDKSVKAACRSFADVGKVIGYACIAPAMIPLIHDKGTQLTIGHDEDTAAAIRQLGGDHVSCAVDEVVFDERANVLSTPAYMAAQNISEAAASIENLVRAVLDKALKG